MTQFSKDEFNRFVVAHDVIGFFSKPITLKSGRQSYWYVNWRTVSEDAYLLDVLTDHVVAFTKDLCAKKVLPVEPACFYGVPEGATKLAVITQMKWAKQSSSFSEGSHVVPMGRAKPKEHGDPKDRFFVGAPRGNTIVLEDVTTTGGSLLQTIDQLAQSDIPVITTFGLTNRMEKRDDGKSVEEAIREKKGMAGSLSYFYLSSALDLLPLAVQKKNPGPQVIAAIEAEFREFGVEAIKL